MNLKNLYEFKHTKKLINEDIIDFICANDKKASSIYHKIEEQKKNDIMLIRFLFSILLISLSILVFSFKLELGYLLLIVSISIGMFYLVNKSIRNTGFDITKEELEYMNSYLKWKGKVYAIPIYKVIENKVFFGLDQEKFVYKINNKQELEKIRLEKQIIINSWFEFKDKHFYEKYKYGYK